MTVRIEEQNGRLVLAIPPEVAAAAGLTAGSEVTVTADRGRLVAESQPVEPHYTLEQLLAGVTPDNIHGEVDWGPPVGKERFWEDE